ncbi:DUF5079 family protein [Mammaliicoccus sp. Dog046]|uniref:DUF5079 family protein n=1 Tax=Mammaliicoccus sp. Dog046 TaxID=3034233 RepID=UPI002B257CCC|nr:DUF5079 family protein [Mammaliicoccus sp. Dog046]WQK85592.1 DUF5079 family protein [Mammaliicoccus sp. Dog046]
MNMSGSINEVVGRFRKPLTQIMSIVTIFILLLSTLTVQTGVGYKYVPNYLRIITLIEIIVVLISFIQCFRFVSFDENFQINKVLLKRYVKGLTILNVIGTLTPVYALTNLFYINAVQHFVDLYFYWLVGMISMTISFLLFIVGVAFMYHSFPKIDKYMSGKTKSFIGLGITFTSFLIYIEKVIEYILVPNVGDNKFIILGSGLLFIMVQVIVYEWIKNYSTFKILILKED